MSGVRILSRTYRKVLEDIGFSRTLFYARIEKHTEFLKKRGFKRIRYHDLHHTNLGMLMTKMSAIDVAKLGGISRYLRREIFMVIQ